MICTYLTLYCSECTYVLSEPILIPNVDQTNWVINLSSRTFNDAETVLLKKELNFAVTPPNIPATEIIAKVESAIRPLDVEQACTVRRTVNSVAQTAKPPRPNITKEMRNALKILREDNPSRFYQQTKAVRV